MIARLVALIAWFFVAFQVYTAGYAPMTAIFQRSIHLGFVLLLLFLTVPVSKRFPPWLRGLVDGADAGLGVVAALLVLEATRRVIGWPMTLIAAFFLAYAYFGPYFPGVFAHKGYGFERLFTQLYLTTEGIFGLPLGVAATFVFVFILFGALLEATGAGKFFIDLAYALAGQSRGGPAKASVISSAFMGSLSGSAIANVVTTGAFTIPLMRCPTWRSSSSR